MLPTPVFLSRKSHGQRSLVGYSPWGHKELDTTEQITHTHMRTHNIHTHNSCYRPYSLDKSMYCCCCCSVAQPWATLGDPTSCSTPGFSVLQYLLSFLRLMPTESMMSSNRALPSISFSLCRLLVF